MNVKEFRKKNLFDENFNLSFDLGPLKVNINPLDKSQFCKALSNGHSYNKTDLMGKKIKKIKTY
jgi:hypothetical protein